MVQHILLIDDEEISNFLTKRLIELIGINARIDSANNGEQALSLINEYPLAHSSLPDLIFLDINMPIMNGFEFLNAFNQLHLPGKENIDVIILSSSMNPKDMSRAKSMGVKEFISQPVTADFIRAICL